MRVCVCACVRACVCVWHKGVTTGLVSLALAGPILHEVISIIIKFFQIKIN